MMSITTPQRRDHLTAAADVKRRPFVGRSENPNKRRLKVDCSTAAWAMSGPASSGGDIADAFMLSNESFVAAVWDAAGHGESAAPQAVLVRAGLHALLNADPDILLAVFALNRVLFRRAQTLPPWPFVSGFFGLVNRESHTLRYISCGHETAILFRGPSAHFHLAHNSPLLGVSEAADLTVDTVDLDRGDRLAIVSNGLTDARPLRSQTDFFGTSRVCSFLRLPPSGCVADASRLIEHVVTFADGALDDDAAALIARFN